MSDHPEFDEDGDDERPVFRMADGRFQLNLNDDERSMICRLLGELREMVTDEEPAPEVEALLERLFPPASSDDDTNSEYQRLMRDELLQSKLSAFDTVDAVLDDGNEGILDEGGLVAFMQSVNSVRLVLGVMLKVSDDPDSPEVMPGFENSREYHLYGYLSWILEWTITALTEG